MLPTVRTFRHALQALIAASRSRRLAAPAKKFGSNGVRAVIDASRLFTLEIKAHS
jgi:hypothetical protein